MRMTLSGLVINYNKIGMIGKMKIEVSQEVREKIKKTLGVSNVMVYAVPAVGISNNPCLTVVAPLVPLKLPPRVVPETSLRKTVWLELVQALFVVATLEG